VKFIPGNFFLLSLTGILLMATPSCKDQQHQQPPYSPKDALSTFQLPEGYRIELVASEPLISDPVEIAFDEDGKMYVAQMDDYPSEKMDDYGEGKEPKSKIMLLEDKDGDGFYESGTAFAEGLPYANGVMPWKGGVLVTSAPDIYFLKDTNGDGKADVKKVVLTGFAVTNPQLRMGSLRYGLDNWIYGAYSRAGGGKWRKEFEGKGNPLQFPDKPGQELAKIFPGTNFRFQPDQFKVEPSGGMSQFGLSFDASGNQFTDWNNVHIRHVVINDKYLSNNPFLSVGITMADISDHGNAAPVYSITKDMLNLHESEMGHFTSACGICEYTGNLFKGKYAKASFVCEPVSNLVHADVLSPDGPTFSATRAENEKEFLASTDSWFRPVNSTMGPDGALYIVDFYRKLVEHPDWLAMADSTGFYTHAGKIKESDFLEGNDRGRVYRIVPKDYKADKKKMPELSKADVQTLVNYLNNPNGWWRINAQRLLVDKKDVNAVPLIKDLLLKDISPEGKIHALWTLEGLNALSDTLLENAFQDAHPMVRKQAVLLAEKRMDNKDILQKIINASADADPYVQFQTALTLSDVAKSNPQVFPALNKIISTHINDKWFQDAVLLGASENAVQWYESFKDFGAGNDSGNVGKKEFLSKTASIVGAKYKESELSSLVKMIAGVKDTSVIVSSLQGVVTGMKRNNDKMKLSAEGQSGLIALISNHPNNVRAAAIEMASRLKLSPSTDLANIIAGSKTIAAEVSQPVESRVLAINVLGLDPSGIPFPLLERFLQSDQPSDIQLAVANVLLRNQQDASTNILLNKWNTFNPKVHEVVETGFLARTERVKSLVKAIESDKIKPTWISRNTQNRLLKYSDTTIRETAKKIFKDTGEGNREQVILDYNVSTTRNGDPVKGKTVFKTVCSVCHLLDGVGVNFGPDLHSISHQTKINLLTMILNPNHDIAAGYEGYTIETTDGRAFAGIIESESDNNIILKSPGGVVQTILKSDVKSMAPMPGSLMPEGLETSVNKDDMADLIEYIKTLK
jgi:putative membrane-bound dehydrogenase-like protein